MKNEKIGITTKDWILSIGGIVILTCLIVLPPVFRIAFKEKKVEEKNDQPVVQYMTCTKNNYVSEGHYQNQTYSLTYLVNTLNEYQEITEMTFDDVNMYYAAKEEYTKLAPVFKMAHVDYTFTPVDGDLKITIKKVFNFGVFQNTSVDLEGVSYQVRSQWSREELVSDIKEDLTTSGYTCK